MTPTTSSVFSAPNSCCCSNSSNADSSCGRALAGSATILVLGEWGGEGEEGPCPSPAYSLRARAWAGESGPGCGGGIRWHQRERSPTKREGESAPRPVGTRAGYRPGSYSRLHLQVPVKARESPSFDQNNGRRAPLDAVAALPGDSPPRRAPVPSVGRHSSVLEQTRARGGVPS